MVINTHSEEAAAKATYLAAQDAHLEALREARKQGETLENLADALECSKQWIHKWTTFGREHNRVSAKSSQEHKSSQEQQQQWMKTTPKGRRLMTFKERTDRQWIRTNGLTKSV